MRMTFFNVAVILILLTGCQKVTINHPAPSTPESAVRGWEALLKAHSTVSPTPLTDEDIETYVYYSPYVRSIFQQQGNSAALYDDEKTIINSRQYYDRSMDWSNAEVTAVYVNYTNSTAATVTYLLDNYSNPSFTRQLIRVDQTWYIDKESELIASNSIPPPGETWPTLTFPESCGSVHVSEFETSSDITSCFTDALKSCTPKSITIRTGSLSGWMSTYLDVVDLWIQNCTVYYAWPITEHADSAVQCPKLNPDNIFVNGDAFYQYLSQTCSSTSQTYFVGT